MTDLASGHKLQELMGCTVQSTRYFAGVRPGDRGKVVEVYRTGKDHSGVMVQWIEGPSKDVRDGFGRDKDFDETQWLEIVHENKSVHEIAREAGVPEDEIQMAQRAEEGAE